LANKYKILRRQEFSSGNLSIVPIRFEDRFDILKWRNEQMYHLRQNKPLTGEEQENYFNTVVSELFDQKKPDQILFSYLEGNKCIGYGGLVHINWMNKNAEISFLMETTLEKKYFEFHWVSFLELISEVAFNELGLHKIFTYAFDLRPKLYNALKKATFTKEAVLKQHVYFNGKFINVIIHSKFNDSLFLRDAKLFDAELTYGWATDPAIRLHSFNKEKIEWENHNKWFSDRLTDINCDYYILNNEGSNIGSIRFDIEKTGNAMISYLIDPIFHGKGFGKIIVEYGVEMLRARRNDVKQVYGLVQKQNVASIRIFEKLGFKMTSEDIITYRFEKVL
jgi:RimJ/RimL family protein N-acetyltransferase